jgi:hypothetical protein
MSTAFVKKNELCANLPQIHSERHFLACLPILSDAHNKPNPFPASQMTLGGLSTSKESSLQGHGKDNARDFEESYQSMDATPLPCLTCDWPSCKSITQYTTTRELKNHQTDVHIAAILKDWPGSCSWPGCNSKDFLQNKQAA